MTRLFDIAEKIKAENVELSILRVLKKISMVSDVNTKQIGKCTFVPFRDTDQDIFNSNDIIYDIFNADIKQLNKLCILIGYLDGYTKDEGVCFEIGYAYGMNAPIVSIITDFIRHDFKSPYDGNEHNLDIILEKLITKKIVNYKLSTAKPTFLKNLHESQRVTHEKLEIYLYELFREYIPKERNLNITKNIDVYIDFGGGLFEWQRQFQNKLADIFKNASISFSLSMRYYSHGIEKDIGNLADADIKNMLNSNVIIICADNTEMDSGSAALQGLAYSANKKIILYDTKNTDITGDNQYRSSRNLMITCSATSVINSFDDILEGVRLLITK